MSYILRLSAVGSYPSRRFANLREGIRAWSGDRPEPVPGRVKSNDNVTEEGWFYQMIMLPGDVWGRTDLKALQGLEYVFGDSRHRIGQ